MTRFKARAKIKGKDEYLEYTVSTWNSQQAELDSSTIQYEIGGEWYTMEEVEKLAKDSEHFKERYLWMVGQEKKLKEENAQLKTEVERLEADKTYKSAMISELQAEAERLKDPKEYRVEFGNHLACGINVDQGVLTVTGAIDGWGNSVPSDEISIKLNP